VVPEAELKQTEAGLVPASVGWFVLSARDARWFHRPGRDSLPLTGDDEFEAETYFPMLGMSIQVLASGEPNSMYHWETEQEDFLVLSGEALLIVEGQERPLKQWDFVHCPPETRHVFLGAGDGACVILATSSRQFQASGPGGFHTVDEAAPEPQRLSRRGDAGQRGRLRTRPALAPGALPRRLATRSLARALDHLDAG
jgi:mannose-6-phosphate isomerase-like protein (cupin superfamily)